MTSGNIFDQLSSRHFSQRNIPLSLDGLRAVVKYATFKKRYLVGDDSCAGDESVTSFEVNKTFYRQFFVNLIKVEVISNIGTGPLIDSFSAIND